MALMKQEFLDGFASFNQKKKKKKKGKPKEPKTPNEPSKRKAKARGKIKPKGKKVQQPRSYRSTPFHFHFTLSFMQLVTQINATAEFTGRFKALEGFIQLSLDQITIYPTSGFPMYFEHYLEWKGNIVSRV